MKKTLIVSVLAAVLAVPALACGGHGKMMSKLDLTSEQKTQMKEFRQAKKEQMKVHKEQRKALRLRKQALLDNYSDAEAEAIAKDMAEMVQAKVLNRMKSTQTIMAILTPEQKEKFKEMMKKRAERKGHHGKKGHHDWLEE